MIILSRKFLLGAIGLTLAAASLQASAQQRIIGGTFVPEGQAQWVVRLNTGCGGSLIASQWVVTAAHCVSSSLTSVRLGSIDQTTGGITRQVVSRIVHPSYNRNHPSGRGPFDIAVLKLDSPVTTIAPISMASADPAVNSTVTLLGWGRTSISSNAGSRYLKQVDTRILASTSGTCGSGGIGVHAGELCIEARADASACHGDSGGPAVVAGVLVGATSGATDNRDCGAGNNNAYSSIAYYRNWIDQQVNGGGGGTGTVVHNINLPSVAAKAWSSTYTVAIPAGTTRLVVNTSGGTGDADLYVYAGATPTTPVTAAVNSSTRCVPYTGSNTETCTIDNPTAGTTYYIRVHAYSAFSGVNMKATRTP